MHLFSQSCLLGIQTVKILSNTFPNPLTLVPSFVLYEHYSAIARSVVRTTKCDNCKEFLVNTSEHEELRFNDVCFCDYDVSTYLDAINRGGLCRPSEYTFTLAVHCWRVYDEIKATDELLNQNVNIATTR